MFIELFDKNFCNKFYVIFFAFFNLSIVSINNNEYINNSTNSRLNTVEIFAV